MGEDVQVITLEDGSLVEGTVDFIQESESTLGPDDESAEVTTRGELEEVQPPDVDDLNTG